MLTGIDPLLSGDLLRLLDHMGHDDTLLVADAHYPSYRSGAPVIDLPVTSPEAVRAIRTVLPLDLYAGPSATLMNPEPGTGEEVQRQLKEAIASPSEDRFEWIDRFAFYERAQSMFAVIRTAEVRKYGCIMIRKGVVGDEESRGA
ncbi:transport protein RbsD/FucU [Brachybacterium halotolerans subsp. kimchii]|uniref:RbsD/FucU family protein n=1 Tax=Brachybacterium halotolerans TaxID=2795215 RepID=UPI001E3ABB2C|nr:RbsD/FucU domain-containing protein [Brachybacterium halotolerans]UEJ81802.1 transport protein RbsD/FucU [Brachybacterium halotolerans subsp. kimchii]